MHYAGESGYIPSNHFEEDEEWKADNLRTSDRFEDRGTDLSMQ